MVMKLSKYLCALLAVVFLVALSVVISGCSEKEVTIISDREEILRYIGESLDGRELFRTAGLINLDTFTIPNDPAIYYDSVLSVTRTTVFLAAPGNDPKRYKEPNLTVLDAEVSVTDRFSVRRYRIDGNDTTTDLSTREFVRYGLFFKLGNDLNPYAGWKLFGFNGGVPEFPMSMTVTASGNITILVNSGLYEQFPYARIDAQTGEYTDFVFRTVESYMRVDQIDNISGGVDIEVSASSVTSQSSYILLGAQTLAGATTLRADRPTTDQYSTAFQSQFAPPYLWNLLVFQEYRSTAPVYDSWVVPYRVP